MTWASIVRLPTLEKRPHVLSFLLLAILLAIFCQGLTDRVFDVADSRLWLRLRLRGREMCGSEAIAEVVVGMFLRLGSQRQPSEGSIGGGKVLAYWAINHSVVYS
jgi:hypothetical protein